MGERRLMVDPHAGSAAFAKSASKELEGIFGTLQQLSTDPVLAEGRFEGGVDLSTGVGYTSPARQLLRGRSDKPEGQKVLVALVKRRPAVLFSEIRSGSLRCGHGQLSSRGVQTGLRPQDFE